MEAARKAGRGVVRGLPAVIKREVSTARLPFNYIAARDAVATCATVDEAKEWGNRAEAVASYARQIQDVSMGDNARRIILRATRRIGELLEELDGAALGPRGRRKDYVSWHKARGVAGKGKAHIAEALAKIPVVKFEHHVAASPVKTPRAVLVAEGVYENAGKRPRTTREQFVDAVFDLLPITQLQLPRDFGQQLARNSTPELKRHIRSLRAWLDIVDQHCNGGAR